MVQHLAQAPIPPAEVSPLLLSDRLIALAQAADGAGYTGMAEQLVTLAYAVLDEPPKTAH